MKSFKDYFLYSVGALFTVLNLYLLIDSFINPDSELNPETIWKDRLINFAGLVFFAGIGIGYYLMKKNERKNNKQKLLGVLIGSLGFVSVYLVLLIYPQEFKKVPIVIKYIISLTGLLFSGAGVAISTKKLLFKEYQ